MANTENTSADNPKSNSDPDVNLESMNQPVIKSAGKGETKENR